MNENIKRILFGNQKQANVINDAVVEDIAEWVQQSYGHGSCETEESALDAITSLLQQSCATHQCSQLRLLKYIVGLECFNIYMSGVPCQLTVEQPSPESPKHLFKVIPLV